MKCPLKFSDYNPHDSTMILPPHNTNRSLYHDKAHHKVPDTCRPPHSHPVPSCSPSLCTVLTDRSYFGLQTAAASGNGNKHNFSHQSRGRIILPPCPISISRSTRLWLSAFPPNVLEAHSGFWNGTETDVEAMTHQLAVEF